MNCSATASSAKFSPWPARVAAILLGLVLYAPAADGPRPAVEAYRGADPVLLAEMRQGLEIAPDSAAETHRLSERLEQALPPDRAEWPPVFQAYRAALEGLAGKHSRAPIQKYNRTQAGLAGFEGLVETYPDSIELRMLRFTFASQLPGFFNRAAQAAADLETLADLLERNDDLTVSPEYRRDAARWILDHGRPPPVLRARLKPLAQPRDFFFQEGADDASGSHYGQD